LIADRAVARGGHAEADATDVRVAAEASCVALIGQVGDWKWPSLFERLSVFIPDAPTVVVEGKLKLRSSERNMRKDSMNSVLPPDGSFVFGEVLQAAGRAGHFVAAGVLNH